MAAREFEHDILVAGDTLVDFMPDEPGPVSAVGGFQPAFGGSGANVAVALDRIEAHPLLWTRIATDGFGQFLAGTLSSCDIPSRFIIRDTEAKTSLAFVEHDESGERGFSFYRSNTADTRMQPGTVPDETVRERSWIHATGVVLTDEPSRSAVLDLLERGTEEERTLSLDPNWRPELWNSRAEYAAVIRGALDLVDVVKGTPEEFATAGISGSDPVEVAHRVAEYGPHTVLLTLGDEGALCYGTPSSPVSGTARHGGFEVEVVDTTGAGDAFLAGAIAGLEAGVTDGERILALANAVGAVATTRAGATTALAGLDQVREFVDEIPWVSSG